MISQDVGALIEEINVWNQELGKDSIIVPKRAMIRAYRGGLEDLKPGDEFLLVGEAYPPAVNFLGKRTIFFPETFTDEQGKERYIEVKGYGKDGKQMYFENHVEGDLNFGMYFERAQGEYELLERVWDLGLHVPCSIALLEMDKAEFIRKGSVTLQEMVAIDIILKNITEQRVNDYFTEEERARIVKNRPDDDYEYLSQEIVTKFFDSFVRDNLQAVEEFRKLYGARSSVQPESRITALINKRSPGYLIRGPLSPLRVGCPSEKLYSEKNVDIALTVGNTYRELLENGILHFCPSTGNWTTAGELTDFADALDIASEQERFEKVMEEYGKTSNPVEFIKYTIGPDHTTDLSPFFIKGIFGEEVPLNNAAEHIVRTYL